MCVRLYPGDSIVDVTDRAVNARSCVLLTKLLAERRESGPGGRVIYFTSGQHISPMPNEIAYAMSKESQGLERRLGVGER